jgi:hypothetical protein
VLAGLSLWNYRKSISLHYRLWQLRSAAASFLDPSGKVIYEEDPMQSSELLAKGGYQRAPYPGTLAGTDWNPVVRSLPNLLQSFNSQTAVLMMHERKLPNGESRVLLVSLQNANREELGQGRVLMFLATLFDIQVGEDSTARPHASVEIPGLAPGDRVRVLAGQVDLKDPSAFSIEFQINEKKQILRGRITDNAGNIELK